MHWGINPLPSKTPHPLFLANPPAPPVYIDKLSNPPFLGNPSLYIGFSWTTTPPPKSRIFQWSPKILKFFKLNTILAFKTKFLVKISQFEFLVMTEKIFLLTNFFKNISDYNLFFYVKIAAAPQKSHFLFPSRRKFYPWRKICFWQKQKKYFIKWIKLSLKNLL